MFDCIWPIQIERYSPLAIISADAVEGSLMELKVSTNGGRSSAVATFYSAAYATNISPRSGFK